MHSSMWGSTYVKDTREPAGMALGSRKHMMAGRKKPEMSDSFRRCL